MRSIRPPRPAAQLFTTLGFCSCLASLAHAQAGTQSPGQLGMGGLGQVTRFDNGFNPAISFSVDSLGEYADVEGGDDGFDFTLRRLDLLAAAWIDPNAWGWAVVAYEGEEGELVLDEAAIEYVGLPGRHTLRAGRFFVDFGKQMQAHLEELRTIDRPGVLADYLGEELAGEGLQWGYWTPLGDRTLLRTSVGVFAGLGGGHHHGGGEEDSVEAEQAFPERYDAGDLSLTARATAMRDVGTRGMLQGGVSYLAVPEYAFELHDAGIEQGGFSRQVVGFDLTYGWTADDGIKSWLVGGEALWMDGDLDGELDDAGTPADESDDFLAVLDESVAGFYAFAEHRMDRVNTLGMQVDLHELPMEDKPDATTYDAYWTRHLSEFLRLRVGVQFRDVDQGEDSTRLALQLTSLVGPHGHGINW